MPHDTKRKYKPLKAYLTIRNSPIDGLGLFAIEHIPRYAELGISHVWSDVKIEGENWIRTPLGGFYNHNGIDPNCGSHEREVKGLRVKFLITKRDIAAGEEITARYTLYDPTK